MELLRGFWTASSTARNHRTLDPDWYGAQTTSIVHSTPLGCLYDDAGATVMAFALDICVPEVQMRYGVAEESKSFVIELAIPAQISEFSIYLLAGCAFDESIGRVSDWQHGKTFATSFPVPDFAREPVYSTWYAYNQEIYADTLTKDVAVAADIGLRSIFVDDGWQLFGSGRGYQGCGDWVADPEKFPDLGGFVQQVQHAGLRVVLWIAPLLLGEQSAAFHDFERFAPAAKASLNCRILDPRHPEVRRRIVDLLAELVRAFGVDGFKLDFLNEAMIYAGTESHGDVDDVGLAMELLLSELRESILAEKEEFLIEFRHPYVSPAISPFANVLRADDCPGDALIHRGAIVDARLVSGARVVHSDPILWDPANVTSLVRQFQAAIFAVPQLSMPLHALDPDHVAAARELITWWRSHRATLLDGVLHCSPPADGYRRITASAGVDEIVAVYGECIVSIPSVGAANIVIVNATPWSRVIIDVESDVEYMVDSDDVADERHPVRGLCDVSVRPYGTVRLRRSGD